MRNNDYKEDHTLSHTLDSHSILRTFDQFPHARDDDGFIQRFENLCKYPQSFPIDMTN